MECLKGTQLKPVPLGSTRRECFCGTCKADYKGEGCLFRSFAAEREAALGRAKEVSRRMTYIALAGMTCEVCGRLIDPRAQLCNDHSAEVSSVMVHEQMSYAEAKEYVVWSAGPA